MTDRPRQPLARFSLALTGLMWTLPFLQPYHRYPITSFYSEWLAFALGLAALALLVARRSWSGNRVPALALAPLALAALIMLQAAFGMVPYFGQALAAALYLTWAALLIVLGSALTREFGAARVITVLSWFLFAGGMLGAAVAFLQHYELSTVFDPLIARKTAQAVFGNLGQPNHFADYTALALVSAAYLYACGRLPGRAAAPAAMLLLFVLGLSGSRSAWVYLTVAFLLAVLLHARRADVMSRRLFACTAFGIVGFVAAQWLATLSWLAPPGAMITATEKLFAGAAGISDRLQLAREAWWMFLQAPLFGLGWGQFTWHHFEFQALFGADVALGPFSNAHDLVLQLLAEAGVVGASLIVVPVLVWLYGLRRSAFSPERWWLLALLGTLAVHSLLEYPLWYGYFLGIAALAFGIGATHFIGLKLDRVGPFAAGLAMAVGAFNVLLLLHDYRDFEQLFTRRPDALMAREFTGIVKRAHRNPLLEPYAELAAALALTADDHRLPGDLALNTAVMHFAPIPDIVYRQALLLAISGATAAAKEQLAGALRVYPAQRPAAVRELAQLAARNPGRFGPLLELATAKSAEQHIPREIK